MTSEYTKVLLPGPFILNFFYIQNYKLCCRKGITNENTIFSKIALNSYHFIKMQKGTEKMFTWNCSFKINNKHQLLSKGFCLFAMSSTTFPKLKIL